MLHACNGFFQVVKVADFGVARFQPLEGVIMTAETGTYRWMAPEVSFYAYYISVLNSVINNFVFYVWSTISQNLITLCTLLDLFYLGPKVVVCYF